MMARLTRLMSHNRHERAKFPGTERKKYRPKSRRKNSITGAGKTDDENSNFPGTSLAVIDLINPAVAMEQSCQRGKWTTGTDYTLHRATGRALNNSLTSTQLIFSRIYRRVPACQFFKSKTAAARFPVIHPPFQRILRSAKYRLISLPLHYVC